MLNEPLNKKRKRLIIKTKSLEETSDLFNKTRKVKIDEQEISKELIINETIVSSYSFSELQKQNTVVASSDTVELIKNCAFKNFINLTSVSFPNVQKIKDAAFYHCINLYKIYIPNIKEVNKCKYSLKDPIYPKGIGIDFVADCPNLSEIYTSTIEQCNMLYATSKVIKEKFDNGSLKLFYGDTLYSPPDYSKISIEPEDGIIKKSDVNEFYKAVTERISSKTAIELEEGVIRDFKNLYRIDIPNIKKFNQFNFDFCDKLSEIHTSTKEQCNTLYTKFLHITKKFNSGELKLFYGDTLYSVSEFLEIEIEPENHIIKKGDFSEFNKLATKKITSKSANVVDSFVFCEFERLTTVDFPNVKEINESAFSRQNLKNVNIPEVTIISNNAFYNCINLCRIDIPKVITISYEAFEFCKNLYRIDIPSIEEFGSDVFKGCENLSEIHTSNEKQCELIYKKLDPKLKEKAKSGQLKLFYGEKILNITQTEEKLIKTLEIGPECKKTIDCYNSRVHTIRNNFTDLQREKTEIISSVTPQVIDEYAFKDFKNLKEARFKNVIKIHPGAFNNCINLIKLYIPSIQIVNQDYHIWGYIEENKSKDFVTNCPNLAEIHTSTIEQCNMLYANSSIIREKVDNGSLKLFYEDTPYSPPDYSEVNIEPKDGVIRRCNITTYHQLVTKKITSETAIEIDKDLNTWGEKLEEIHLLKIKKMKFNTIRCCKNLQKIYIPQIETIGNKYGLADNGKLMDNESKIRFAYDCPKLTEIHTSTIKQCEVIYKALCKDMKDKVLNGQLKIYYEGGTFNPTEIK